MQFRIESEDKLNISLWIQAPAERGKKAGELTWTLHGNYGKSFQGIKAAIKKAIELKLLSGKSIDLKQLNKNTKELNDNLAVWVAENIELNI